MEDKKELGENKAFVILLDFIAATLRNRNGRASTDIQLITQIQFVVANYTPDIMEAMTYITEDEVHAWDQDLVERIKKNEKLSNLLRTAGNMGNQKEKN